MNAEDACKLIHSTCFRKDWKITAECNERYENCVKVTVNYPAQLSNAGMAPHYPISIEGGLTVERNIMVGELESPLELWRRLLAWFGLIHSHEDREFFRVWNGEKWVAPFHPHTTEGMKLWGDELGDLIFGAAG